MSGTVELPATPKDTFFEELVLAHLHCAGYYVDHHIIERAHGLEILELDAYVSDLSENPYQPKLVEAKSGTWGFKDLFKLRGWLTYLDYDGAFLFVSNAADGKKDALFRKRAQDLGIRLVVIDSTDEIPEDLTDALGSYRAENYDIVTWRFAYWLERTMLRSLKAKAKSNTDCKRYGALHQYYEQINNDIFFSPNLIDRIEALYRTFQETPKFTARCATEMAGGDFDADDPSIPEDLFRSAFYRAEDSDIHTSCLVEHRARLALLKCGIEFKMLRSAGVDDERTESLWSILGTQLDRYDMLPEKFTDGLEEISQEPYYTKYPVFWQWFTYVFGGFILKDYWEQELQGLSERTGIPVDHIEQALNAYQKLFPRDSGWMYESPHSAIRKMTFFPMPLHGIGANYRRLAYTDSAEFEALELSTLATRKDIEKWNNLAHRILVNPE